MSYKTSNKSWQHNEGLSQGSDHLRSNASGVLTYFNTDRNTDWLVAVCKYFYKNDCFSYSEKSRHA